MKKPPLLSSLVATLFLGTLHLSQAQTDSTPNVILETTVARYCQGMQLIGTLDDQTKLFWSHDNSFNYIIFPDGNENRELVSLTHLQSNEGPHVAGLIKYYDAYAALFNDHTLLVWGDKEAGGEMPAELSGEKVIAIAATEGGALAVILEKDHSVVAWGNPAAGGTVPESLRGKRVTSLAHTRDAFAALLENGRVVSWGANHASANMPPIDHVVSLFGSNSIGFTAIIRDGEKEKLFSWDMDDHPYTVPDIGPQHVKSIIPSAMAFTAVLDDDTLISWGRTEDHISAPLLQPGEKILSLLASDRADQKVAYLNSGRLLSWFDYYPSEYCSATKLPVVGKKALKTTENAILFDDNSGFSWDIHGEITPLYPHGDIVDIISTQIYENVITLSSEGTVSEGLHDITPSIPQNQKIIALASNYVAVDGQWFDGATTLNLLPIDLLSQFAIAGDEMNPFDPNRLGNWEYQMTGSDEWKPLQFFRFFSGNTPVLRADTKIRFLSNKIDDPYFVPQLTMKRID